MIEIKESHPFESRYICLIQYGKYKYDGTLTYSNKSVFEGERDTILINGNSELGKHLINDDPKIGKLYREVINKTPSVNKMIFENGNQKILTRIEAIKEIVNEIEQETSYNNNLSYAIHKFGYVPIIIPDIKNEKINSKYKIGIYPQEKQESTVVRKRLKYPAGITNDSEFLKSLTITPFKLFRKYLEDIGEYLYLIEHTNELDSVLKYCKTIEEIKGESIDSKLDVVYSERERNQISKDLANYLKNHPAIFMAKFGRELSMLLINEIYSIVGISDRINIYHHRLRDLVKIYEYKIKSKDPDWLKLKSGLNLLIEILKCYHRIDTTQNLDLGKKLIEHFPNKYSWGRRFGEFLLFLNILKQENIEHKYNPTVPKIFISYLHNIDSSEKLLSEISEHGKIKAKYNSVTILKLSEKRDHFIDQDKYHEQFKRVSRSLIWLSDQVIVIVPKTDSKKNYKWLYREIEHSLLKWDKKDLSSLIYFKEDNVSNNEFLKDLKELNYDFLSIDFRKTDNERLTVINEHYEVGKKIEFKSTQGLQNGKIQDELINFYYNIPVKKVTNIIKGYISQFTSQTILYNNIPNHGWLIMSIVNICDNEFRDCILISEKISLILKNKENKIIEPYLILNLIRNLKNQIKNRKLKILDKELEILEFSNNGKKLKCNMLNVLSLMLPNSNEYERLEIREEIYNFFLEHKQSDLIIE